MTILHRSRKHLGLQRNASILLLGLLLLGCAPANSGDPNFWAPYVGPGDAGGAGGAVGSSGQTGGGGTGGAGGGDGGVANSPQLAFRFTTISVDGEYAPKNVGAVWVTREDGAFVKTLELWGSKRAKHLVKWNAASSGNVVDAVTGATRKAHGPHEVYWDGTDVAGLSAVQGSYEVHVEFTEWNSASAGNSPGPSTWMSFLHAPTPQDVAAPDVQGFTGMQLVYEP